MLEIIGCSQQRVQMNYVCCTIRQVRFDAPVGAGFNEIRSVPEPL